MIPEERWEALERIGAYAAGELEGEEAREIERLITESTDHQELAQAYVRMLTLLSVIGQEAPGAPEEVMSHAIRRAYVSAFFRQAEALLGGLGKSYAAALISYLGLRA
jgi:anti-sigma-K factor RskA